MASAISTEKFSSGTVIDVHDHDPGATTAVLLSADGGTTKVPFDMSDYGGIAFLAAFTTGTDIQKLEIVAAEDEALSTNLTVVKDSGSVAADALGDFVYLECTAEEIKQLGANLRYASARLTMETNTDECLVTSILFNPRFAYTGLTATTVA